jgi:hypothetical protein
MIEEPKIEQKIRKFYEAFKNLKGDEKLFFISEIEKATKGVNVAEKGLYLKLIKAAHEGKTVEEAIELLKKG